MTKITVDVEIVPEQCCNCGVHFGIDHHHHKSLKETGATFYCPNGHSQYYTKKEQMDKRVKELEAQLQEAETDRKYLSNSLKFTKGELDYTKRSLSATKGVLTRTKNRIHKGVCPVCNRQFENLHRHMEGKHPDYLKDDTEPTP